MIALNCFFDFISTVLRLLIKNKALIIVGVFLVYLIFFDEYNLRTRIKVGHTNDRLTEQKEMYVNLINYAKQDKKDLENNYEKFAREKFKMSKADEDVFIIETKKLKEK